MAPTALDEAYTTQVSLKIASARHLTAPQSPFESWPSHLDASLAWSGNTVEKPEDFVFELSPSDIAEIKNAMSNFRDQKLYGSKVVPETFPLPSLGERLTSAAKEVHKGKGYIWIRGLLLEDFTAEDSTVVYLGIANYIGAKRAKQDVDCNMLGHVISWETSTQSGEQMPVRNSTRTPFFHNDQFCDVVGLMCRNAAVKGGAHQIASSWNIYNRLAATRPDILRTLAAPIWSFNPHGIAVEPENRPLLFYHDARILLNLNREALSTDALAPEQIEALDAVQTLADECKISISLQPGDLLFLNNHALLHSREPFEDGPAWRRRHLVRLWLKNESLAWKLPEAVRVGNEAIYRVDEEEETWNVFPVPLASFTIAQRWGT